MKQALLSLGVILSLAGAAVGQESATDRKLNFTFRDASIEVVLRSLSQVTGWIFVLESSPRGTITAVSNADVPLSRCLEFLNASLKQHGLVVLNPAAPGTPSPGDTLRVLDIARALKDPSHVHVGLDPRDIPPTDEPRTQILPLRSAGAAEAAKDFGEVFRRLLGEGGQLAPSAFSNSILVSGPSVRVRSVAEILSIIDQTASAHSRFVVIPLRYTDAVQAAKTLNDVFKPDVGRSDAGPQPRLPGFLRALSEPATPAAKPSPLGSIRITPESRTNSLIAGATEENLLLIKALVEEIDRPSAALNVYVVPLVNTDAASTAAALNNLWNNSNGAAAQKPGNAARADGTLNPGQVPFRETAAPSRSGSATPRR